MVNRRMFRPGFPDVKEPSAARPPHNGPVPSKKPAPPEITHAENFYWVKQMQSHTPMAVDRKSTRLNSSHGYISYAVFCLKKKENSRLRQLNLNLTLILNQSKSQSIVLRIHMHH